MTKTEGLPDKLDASAGSVSTHPGPPVDVDTTTSSPWLTVREAAKVVKCGRRLIYREVKAGRLVASKIGLRRDLRIHRDWIDEWLKRCAAPVEVKP